MIKSLYLMPVEQPIGTLYVGKICTDDLLNVYTISRRDLFNDGYQRQISKNRVINIADYLEDPDATFPTSIIISIKNNDVIGFEQVSQEPVIYKMTYESNCLGIFEIIDGQHRIEGLDKAVNRIQELPVVVLFDLTQEEKAYIFSVINSNQKQVQKSLIYDLFGLTGHRSPNRTCHIIAKTFNTDEKSPFFRRIKMLGSKKNDGETISQGSFVSFISKLITNDSDKDGRCIKNNIPLPTLLNERYVLRSWFIKEQDSKIYKALYNYFAAAKEVFPIEWDGDGYILTKTTGIGALCKAFPKAFHIGKSRGTLSQMFFKELFIESKETLKTYGKELTAKEFGTGEAKQRELSILISENWG